MKYLPGTLVFMLAFASVHVLGDLTTEVPTDTPTDSPTDSPTDVPTDSQTDMPQASPLNSPTLKPIYNPTVNPSTLVPSTLLPTSALPTKAPTVLPICQFGGYCAVDSDCIIGNKCYIQNQYYSQCIPDPSTYKTTNNCKSNWGDQCSSTAECCDPGSICNNNSWRQCQQPTNAFPYPAICQNPAPHLIPIASPTKSVPTEKPEGAVPSGKPVFSPTTKPINDPTAKPVNDPTGKPVFQPTTKPINDPTAKPVNDPTGKPVLTPVGICQWGGYCRSTSDCLAGNKCNVQNKYYSQCIPDTSTYKKDSLCSSNWSKCAKASDCCDPGAICSNKQCQQPAIGSGYCSNPSGF